MPKYWGKQIFTKGSFPEVGQKQKTEKKKKEEKKERKLVIRLASYALQLHLGWRGQRCLGQKVGENNCKLRFVRHHGCRTQARLYQQYSIYLCQNIGGNKVSDKGVSPKWIKSRRRRRRKKKKKSR